MFRYLSVSSCALFLAISPGSPQTTLKDTIPLEEVVVTATKTMVNRNFVPVSVSVVTSAQIEESSESALLPVLSEQVPGVFITRRGITGFGVATGSAGAINIRGMGGSPNTQTLILLNGNPQFMGIMGHPLPDAYVASDVERVEVIRGPASALYGSNAMGGVINIITRKQTEDGLSAGGRLMYGSYNTQKYMANGGFKKKGFQVFGSFNHDQTNGHRDSSDFSINNGYLRAGYELNDNLSFSADFSLAGFKATDPGPEDTFAGNTIDILRGMGALAFENQYDRTSGSARFFYNFGEHNITDGFHSLDKNFGVIIYQSFRPFHGNTVTLGIDHKEYGGMAENLLAMGGQGVVFGDTTVRETAGYGYIQQNLSEKLMINAGFRLDHNSVFGFEPVPSGGVAYQTSPNTSLKFSIGKGFRSPTIRELYLWAPANEDLMPEKMINAELSIRQKLLNEKLSLELTGFRAKGENLIATVIGQGGPRNENTGSFSNAGVEFAGIYLHNDKLFLHLNYSFIAMDEPILATPRHQFFTSGTWKVNKLSVNLSLQHINGLVTRVSPEVARETYTLLNTRIAYKINSYFDIFMKGENLSRQKYYINYGYPMPGFLMFGGLNFRI